MLNRCEFIGNLGRDPEMRTMPNGDSVVEFSVAATRKWKSRDGERQEETEWIPVTVFGKLADICGQYLVQGSKVYIAGRWKTDKWEDRETGQKRSKVKLIGFEMVMLGEKQQREEGGGSRRRDYDHSSNRGSGHRRARPPAEEKFEATDDDIPF